jgi:hypothetical protein
MSTVGIGLTYVPALVDCRAESRTSGDGYRSSSESASGSSDSAGVDIAGVNCSDVVCEGEAERCSRI